MKASLNGVNQIYLSCLLRCQVSQGECEVSTIKVIYLLSNIARANLVISSVLLASNW